MTFLFIYQCVFFFFTHSCHNERLCQIRYILLFPAVVNYVGWTLPNWTSKDATMRRRRVTECWLLWQVKVQSASQFRVILRQPLLFHCNALSTVAICRRRVCRTTERADIVAASAFDCTEQCFFFFFRINNFFLRSKRNPRILALK